MHQEGYAKTVEELYLDATFDEFRALRLELASLFITRPDICAMANILSQVTEALLSQTHIKQINKDVKEVKGHPNADYGHTMYIPQHPDWWL